MGALVAVMTGLVGCEGSVPSSVPSSTPAAVAVAYTNDLFSNRLADAMAMVLPSSQGDFKLMETLVSQQSGSAHGLVAGATRTSGNSAVVVLLGTICMSGSDVSPGRSAAPGGARCLSNADPGSTNPGFKVSLQKASDGKWYVYFPA
jgi:hypothetical protein